LIYASTAPADDEIYIDCLDGRGANKPAVHTTLSSSCSAAIDDSRHRMGSTVARAGASSQQSASVLDGGVSTDDLSMKAAIPLLFQSLLSLLTASYPFASVTVSMNVRDDETMSVSAPASMQIDGISNYLLRRTVPETEKVLMSDAGADDFTEYEYGYYGYDPERYYYYYADAPYAISDYGYGYDDNYDYGYYSYDYYSYDYYNYYYAERDDDVFMIRGKRASAGKVRDDDDFFVARGASRVGKSVSSKERGAVDGQNIVVRPSKSNNLRSYTELRPAHEALSSEQNQMINSLILF
jgi:hypothetical protein